MVGYLGLLALTQCSTPPPPPPVLNLTITGAADQNPDPKGRASPVAVRIYQLGATAKFEQSDVFALKDNEAKTLGTEEAAPSQQFLIGPGDARTMKIDLKPLVSAIGVAVMYRDIDHAQWRASVPAKPSGPTTVSVTVGKQAVTMKGG
jgi:type VI secretion system protein VasD